MNVSVQSSLPSVDAALVESDRYGIEGRLVDGDEWVASPSFPDLFDSKYAAEIVRQLNEVAVGMVFRSVLVSV